MSQVPETLKYSRTHEWTRLEDDGTLTICGVMLIKRRRGKKRKQRKLL